MFAVEGDGTDEIEIPVAVALYLLLNPCIEIVGAVCRKRGGIAGGLEHEPQRDIMVFADECIDFD